jgi:hypothetical protein
MVPLGLDTTTLLYFLAGAGGTFLRVWLSPVMENWGRQMLTHTIVGGVVGIVLPALGGAVTPSSIAVGSPVIKAAVLFLGSFSGSFALGEILVRLGLAKPAPPVESKTPTPVPPPAGGLA